MTQESDSLGGMTISTYDPLDRLYYRTTFGTNQLAISPEHHKPFGATAMIVTNARAWVLTG